MITEEMKEQMREAICLAVENAGGPVKMASHFDGVTYQAVQRWMKVRCPDNRVLMAEKYGDVPKERLRPDIFLYPDESSAA